MYKKERPFLEVIELLKKYGHLSIPCEACGIGAMPFSEEDLMEIDNYRHTTCCGTTYYIDLETETLHMAIEDINTILDLIKKAWHE